jgi:hypothetical protein
VVALYVALGVVVLLLRVLDLGLFLDSDEVNFWLGRSEEFLEALQRGDYAATAISTHPGVTTMWLGSAGIVLRRTLLDWGLVDAMPFPLLLALMRVPVALAHTAGVLVGFVLLRRMLPAAVALLAALLWAADPFVVAYSRILHVDGLTTTFVTLSLLAACVYWHHGRQWGLLVLSAVCGALAVLSKSPGLIVLPLVGLIALWNIDTARPLSSVGRPLLVWGALFALVLVVVWPAVWADPARVVHLLRVGVEVEGGSPHVIGNFFLGRETDTPGPLYYPVALLLRTTPITLAGVLLLPFVWRRDPELAPVRRDLLVLVVFIVLFLAAMTLFPKKLNRYAVPVFPALDVLAAVGLAWGAGRLLALRQWGAQARQRVAGALLGGVALLAVANAAWWHPYGVVAFNQVLGGAPTGARTFLLGDGEGLRQVAEWLHQQPDITGVTVASTMINSLQPFLHQGVQSVSPEDGRLDANTGYVMIYLRHVQRTLQPPFDQFYPEQTPLHVVRIHGVDYAWIYQVPPSIANPLDARFGDDITLTGYAVDSAALRSTGTLSLTVQWQADAPLAEDYMLFAHLLDADGQRVAQIDAPPAGGMPTSTWEPSRYITWVHPLPVPPNLSEGTYWLALGLYNPATLERLPVRAPLPPDAPGAGGDALLLPAKVP